MSFEQKSSGKYIRTGDDLSISTLTERKCNSGNIEITSELKNINNLNSFDSIYVWKSNMTYSAFYSNEDSSDADKESPILVIKEVLLSNNILDADTQNVCNKNSKDKNSSKISDIENKGENILYTYYPNGRIEYIGPMSLDKKRNGIGQWFYSNGKIRYKGTFKNGGPTGKHCKIYYSNERIQYFGEMSIGQRQNLGKCYYDNGVMCIDGKFVNDKLEGEDITIYWSNGKLQYYGQMKDGKCEGRGKAYYLSGKLRYDGLWKNDWPHGDNIKIYKENGE